MMTYSQRRAGAVVVNLVILIGLGLNIWLGIYFSARPTAAIVSEIATGGLFALGGTIAWSVRPRSKSGPWMIAAGIAVFGGNLVDLRLVEQTPGQDLLQTIGLLTFWFAYPMSARLILAYPGGNLRAGAERLLVTAAFAFAAISGVVSALTYVPDPAICRNFCIHSLLALNSERALALVISDLVLFGWSILGVITIALVVRRWQRATPRERWVLGWASLIFAIAGLLFIAVAISAAILGQTSTTTNSFGYAHQWLGLVALPIAFFVGLLIQRLEFASLGSLMRLIRQTEPADLEAALRRGLHDPRLRLHPPCGPPGEPDPTRRLAPVGEPAIAIIDYDASMDHNEGLVPAATTAIWFALTQSRPQDPAPSRAFISYSRVDQRYVQRLAIRLADAGIDVTYDHDIAAGDRFARLIQDKIDQCAAVIVVMSPEAISSTWVERELSYAALRGKPIVPLLLRPCDPPLIVAGLNWENVTDGQPPSDLFILRLKEKLHLHEGTRATS